MDRPLWYFMIQFIFWCSDYLLLVLFSNTYGFDALGINYFFAYIGYLLMSFGVSYRVSGFRFSRFALSMIGMSFAFTAVAWLIARYMISYSLILGSLLLLINGYWIIRTLKKHMNIDPFKLLSRLFDR